MMRLTTALALAATASACVTGVARAQPKDSGPARVAGREYGRMSQDGARAFNDIVLARRAIFDGRTDAAVKFVADAEVSIHKVKADDSLMLKAENLVARAPSDDAKAAPVPATKGAAIAWVPIDSDIAIGETFVATPESSAALVGARKSLEQGDGARSLATIRLAGIDVDYTVSVAPLMLSTIDIDRAKGMLAANDYYGASQALRHAENGVRYEEFDDVGDVANQATASSAKTH
jgi:hypothetical protein